MSTWCVAKSLAICLLCASAAIARDNGQYSASDPARRQWFREQISPKTGKLCCDEADGGEAQEDIRDGHYWVTWPAVSPRWYQVPDDVVISQPDENHPGHPVVWVYYEQGQVKIRCFAPGAKL